MPNHVENYLYISQGMTCEAGEGIDGFLAFLKAKREEYKQKSIEASDIAPNDDGHQNQQTSAKERYLITSREILSAQFFIPMPEEEAQNWYDWCISNWGTKWGFYDAKDHGMHHNKYLHYTFTTAWSTPDKVIKAMSKLFPKLVFRLEYFEGGDDFCGIDEYNNGLWIGGKKDSYSTCDGEGYLNFGEGRGG